MAALNAYLLWITKYPDWKKNNKCRRKQFIRDLSIELIKPNVIKRKQLNLKYHRQQLDAFNTVLLHCGEMTSETAEINISVTPRETQIRGSCSFCDKNSRKRSRIFCDICNDPVCAIHRSKVIACPACSRHSSLE